jgi:hypothetical protein
MSMKSTKTNDEKSLNLKHETNDLRQNHKG